MKWVGLLFVCLFGIAFRLHGAGPELGVKSHWRGYVTQHSDDALAEKYDFEIHFTGVTETENGVKGETRVNLIHDKEVFAVISFEGLVSGTVLRLQEQKIIRQNIYHNAWWCIKSLVLTRADTKDKAILKGTWNSPDCNGDGEVYLERVDDK